MLAIVGALLMAVLTFAPNAALGGIMSYMQQQQFLRLCGQENLWDRQTRILRPGTYAEAGDTVRLSAFLASGSAVINFGGQVQNEEGEFRRYNRQLAVSSGASPARVTMPATAGWYRDAVASLETAGITGQTLYVTQELGRTNGGSFGSFAMLAQGWLTSTAPVSDGPNFPPDAEGGGGGACVCPSTMRIRSIDGIQSAQGWQDNYTPAAGTVERVWALVVNATMAGAATNKYLFTEVVYVGTGPVAWAQTPLTLVAPNSYALLSYVDRGASVDSGVDFYRELPAALWLSEQYQVQVGIGNFQAGDAIIDAYAIIEVMAE